MELRYKLNTEMLDGLIAGGHLCGKSIFVFGHCAATERMIDYLEERETCVSAIFDNNKQKAGSKYKTVSIVTPEYIQGFTAANSIVLIATRFYEQMSSQLRQLGYDGRIEKLIDYNSPVEYSISDDTIKRKIERTLKGKKILETIRRQYPKEHLVICPLNAIGDVYVTMSFIPEYLKRNQHFQSVVIVNGDGCRQIADMFEATTITLDDTEMDEFVQAVIFTGEPNNIIAHHDRVYTDNTVKWLDKHKMTFEDYYKHAIFGLPKSAKPVEPTRLEPFHNTHDLLEGNTVIIAPYAKSVVGIPTEFWQEIICRYKSKGYCVATSVSGDETPLDNTIALSFPLNQAVSAVEFAGIFIGIRSGLCDVIRNSNCDKTVIFPDRYYSTTQLKLIEFWGLPKWKQIQYSR